MIGWRPDEEFLRFLETIPIRSETARSVGQIFLREMRLGTPAGRELYENSYRDLRERYELYRTAN